MTHYNSFEPRTDPHIKPDDRMDLHDSAKGQLVEAGADNDETVVQQLTMLLNADQDVGRIIEATTDPDQRLNMLEALAIHHIGVKHVEDPDETSARVHELIAKCRHARTILELVLRPAWVGETKVTAEVHPASGLHINQQTISTVWLQDATDYVTYLADEVEHLALHLGLADVIIPEGGVRVRYCVRANSRQVVDRFVFDRLRPFATDTQQVEQNNAGAGR